MTLDQAQHFDWQGAATFILAIGTLIGVIATAIINVVNIIKSNSNGSKLDTLKTAVDGHQTELVSVINKAMPDASKVQL